MVRFHNAVKLMVCILAALQVVGCISMSRSDQMALRQLKSYGIGETEQGTKHPAVAAGLNLLPGIGNFYLAVGTEHPTQWTIGFINLLFWPCSVVWGIPQGAIDANTINKMETVYYYKHDLQGKREFATLRAQAEALDAELAAATYHRPAAAHNGLGAGSTATGPVVRPNAIPPSWRAPKNTRLLSVGVGSFKDPSIPKVSHAHDDARQMAGYLQSCGVPRANITHLSDTQATRSNITEALMKLKLATTEESETSIFYFSGHGAPILEDGKIVDAALIPYDAFENSLDYTGIKVSTLNNMLADTHGNFIVILDACFSGKEGRSIMAKNIKSIAVVPRDFSVIPETNGRSWWVTSTSGNNFANVFPQMQQGLFTYYFIKSLDGADGVDANSDGLVSLKEAFQWTKTNVASVSAKTLGRLQIPEMRGPGDIILTIPR